MLIDVAKSKLGGGDPVSNFLICIEIFKLGSPHFISVHSYISYTLYREENNKFYRAISKHKMTISY